MCVCCARAWSAAAGRRPDGVRRASRARVLRAARAPRALQFRALEHPAHRFTLPCCRRQPPVRVRPRAVPLAPARRRFASGVPMQNARISLHAAAFGARSASEQLSEVPNQQQTRLQHPSSWSITSLEVARGLSQNWAGVCDRLFWEHSARKRALRAPRDIIRQRKQKIPIINKFAPQKRHRPPPHVPTADAGRSNTSPGSGPGEKTLFTPKRSRRKKRPHTSTTAPRADAARARAIAHNQAVHRGTKPRARGSPHNQGKPIWPRRRRRPPSRRSSRAAWPPAVSTN